MADRPYGDAAGEDLWEDKGGAGIRDMGAAGEQLAVEMQRCLAAINKADVDKRQPVFVSQRGIEQADVEARSGITAVQFHAGPRRYAKPARPAKLAFYLPFAEGP